MSQPVTTTVAVKLPSAFVSDEEAPLLGAHLRALWAVEQVRRKRCGVGKGAELAGMPRAGFMRMRGEHGIPVIDYDVEDLREELRGVGAA